MVLSLTTPAPFRASSSSLKKLSSSFPSMKPLPIGHRNDHTWHGRRDTEGSRVRGQGSGWTLVSGTIMGRLHTPTLKRWWVVTFFVLNQKHRPVANSLFGDASLNWPSYDMKLKHNLVVSLCPENWDIKSCPNQGLFYPTFLHLISLQIKVINCILTVKLAFRINRIVVTSFQIYLLLYHCPDLGQCCAPWFNWLCCSRAPVAPCQYSRLLPGGPEGSKWWDWLLQQKKIAMLYIFSILPGCLSISLFQLISIVPLASLFQQPLSICMCLCMWMCLCESVCVCVCVCVRVRVRVCEREAGNDILSCCR